MWRATLELEGNYKGIELCYDFAEYENNITYAVGSAVTEREDLTTLLPSVVNQSPARSKLVEYLYRYQHKLVDYGIVHDFEKQPQHSVIDYFIALLPAS